MIMLNNNLRIFITTAELGNLTEAAKKLYVSQPAISQSIKKLEEELNIKLFIRNKRSNLILTDAGRDILALAYKMADLENKLYQRAYEENHMLGGTVKIASVPLGISLILSHVLPVFRRHFPDVHVELLEGSPLEVKNMIFSFQADFGITTSPYMNMEHRLLMMDRMVSISKNEAAEVNLKNPVPDLILCRVALGSIEEQLAGQDIDLSHAQIVQAASTQINLIEEGNGVGVISELMLSTIPNQLVRGCVVPKMDAIEISLVTQHFNELSTAAKEMSEMILEQSKIE